MTVGDVIRSALTTIRVVPSGGGIPGSLVTSAFVELNSMLQHWAAEGLNLHALTTSTPKTLTIGDPSYTIGSGGSIADRRPVEIVAAKVVTGGLDYSLKVFNSAIDYLRYIDKTTQSRPYELYYDAAFASALATIWLYPSPDVAYVLTLYSMTSIAPFTTTAETINLPPEYEYALSTNLAAHLASMYSVTDAALHRRAEASKSVLANNNAKRHIRLAQFDSALLNYEGGNLNSVLTGSW